jgi:mitogen-activated protein kinase kinase 1 interacting protein 1
MEDLRRLIVDIASHTNGILGVVISDKDGVPVLKAVVDTSSQIVDSCFRHQFLSVYGTLSEHASKMCLGPTKSIFATFDNYQVIHCNHAPLILTVIASQDAMPGELINLSQSMAPLITDIAKAVVFN